MPKVIDFGIAKATSDQPLTDKTLFTAFEQFMGTPAYMSPEQAQLSGLDIDTRTDIYSLGVLLYELLTGNPPFDPEELMRSGVEAMRRTIREKEPVRPSTRLRQSLAASGTSSRLAPRPWPLATDLDWIVMTTWVAVGEKDEGRLSIWDLQKREEIMRFPSDKGPVFAAFSPRARLLAFSRGVASASGNQQRSVWLWEGDTRRILAELPLEGPCRGLVFSGDGQRLVTLSAGFEGQLTL